MDESSRVPQRSRPRPYDLRRKVLLKNFLREQMTHIPLPPPRLPMEDDSIADDEVSSTVGNEENIEQSSNIQEKINNKQESASPALALDPGPSTSSSHFTSTENSPDSSTSQEPEIEVDKSTQPTFTRLSNLLRLKINSVRSRRKGITKAKLKMKAKIPAHQGIVHASNNAEQSTKGKSKSFFTMFKTRRVKRNIKSPTRISSPVFKSTTSNQSVQTDVSFTQDEFNNMEQSNRCLREENRLLSESLSSFMSDFDLKLSPLKIPYGTDSYITSSGSSQSPSVSHQTSPDVAKRLDYNDNASRNKIPRSKSMQDRFDKKFPNRSRLRTRSMNYGLNKRFYDSSSLQQRDPNPYRRNFPPATSNNFINSSRRGKHRPNSFSSFDSSPNRISTPEPNSRMLPHRPSVLKNLPINNSSRAIVRRSSMPERTSYQPSRPILRHKSTRVNGYNHGNVYDNGYNYNVVNGNGPIRRRSNSNGDYGRPVPFQSLPPEAFY